MKKRASEAAQLKALGSIPWQLQMKTLLNARGPFSGVHTRGANRMLWRAVARHSEFSQQTADSLDLHSRCK